MDDADTDADAVADAGADTARLSSFSAPSSLLMPSSTPLPPAVAVRTVALKFAPPLMSEAAFMASHTMSV